MDRSRSELQLRLVKLRSDVIPDKACVALIDGRTEGVVIGRDRSYTARIRVPSMEVSKHHANIFAMNAGDSFAIADMGSTHGTFLTSHGTLQFRRLSPPKRASAPCTLSHLDIIRLGQGSTEFEIHLHSGWASSCESCSLDQDGGNEIRLEAQDRSREEKNGKGPMTTQEKVKSSLANTTSISNSNSNIAGGDRKIESELLRRQAMGELRSKHLQENEHAGESSKVYKDRAAERRARVGIDRGSSKRDDRKVSEERPAKHGSTEKGSSANVPLSQANRGYQMYSRMDAKTDQSSLDRQMASVRGVDGRAGLGSKRLLEIDEVNNASESRDADPERRLRRRYEDAVFRERS